MPLDLPPDLLVDLAAEPRPDAFAAVVLPPSLFGFLAAFVAGLADFDADLAAGADRFDFDFAESLVIGRVVALPVADREPALLGAVDAFPPPLRLVAGEPLVTEEAVFARLERDDLVVAGAGSDPLPDLLERRVGDSADSLGWPADAFDLPIASINSSLFIELRPAIPMSRAISARLWRVSDCSSAVVIKVLLRMMCSSH